MNAMNYYDLSRNICFLGTAMTIIYSAPIFTMIFSFVFLRIKQGLYKIFFALILIVGVLLVIRPPFLFPNLKPNVEPHPISNQTVTNTNQTSPAEDHSETKDNIYWIGVAICVVTAACTGLISVVFNYLQVIFLLYLILRILFVRKNVIDLVININTMWYALLSSIVL